MHRRKFPKKRPAFRHIVALVAIATSQLIAADPPDADVSNSRPLGNSLGEQGSVVTCRVSRDGMTPTPRRSRVSLTKNAGERGRAELPNASGRQRVVLLTNGQTLRGTVTRSRDRVEIHQPGARITLSRNRVQWIGDSLEAVYGYQQHHMSSQSAPAHLRLASWCLEQRLFEHAAHHVAAAQRANPTHAEIDTVRQRLLQCWASENASQDHEPRRPVRPDNSGSAVQTAQFRSTTSGSDTVSRIDPSAMRAFTRRVQPLLVTRCGMAGCHGTHAKNEFQLFDMQREIGLPSTITHRNLRTVLRQIDPNSPAASPLLTRGAAEHGIVPADRRRRDALRTPEPLLANDQLKWLRQWVLDVSDAAVSPTTKPAASRSDVVDPFDPQLFNQRAPQESVER